MLTIDEAIIHCEEVAKKKKEEADSVKGSYNSRRIEKRICLDSAEEHLQLASWLRELKDFRDKGRRFIDDV